MSHSAPRWIAATGVAMALAVGSGCGNEPDSHAATGVGTTDATTQPPAQVAMQDPAARNTANPAHPATPPSTTGGPSTAPAGNPAPDPTQPLNPQTVHKIIEDNITMREEIRRLKIERENLIRLLRAMGENYQPKDEQK